MRILTQLYLDSIYTNFLVVPLFLFTLFFSASGAHIEQILTAPQINRVVELNVNIIGKYQFLNSNPKSAVFYNKQQKRYETSNNMMCECDITKLVLTHNSN